MPAKSFPDHSFHQQLDAIKNNSQPILQQLYSQNYKTTEQYVLQNNGSIEEAKDIFQEAFIAVWRNIQLGKFTAQNNHSLSAYLFQVSKNKWISHLRSASYKNTRPLETEVEEVEEEMLAPEEHNYLNELVEHFEKLGENCRDLLRAFYYKKRSLRDIAEQFKWTEATARNNKYRCIEKLRNLLKDKK